MTTTWNLFVVYGFVLLVHYVQAQNVTHFLLKMDWLPSSCASWSSCIENGYQEFGIWGLEMYSATGNSPSSCPTTIVNVAPQLSSLTTNRLDCVFKSFEGDSNSALWDDQWKFYGSCSGLSVEAYFRTLTEAYRDYNPNVVLFPEGNPVSTPIDHDELTSKLTSTFGARTFVECNLDGSLQNVVVCLQPTSPFTAVDCPVIPEDPNSKLLRGSQCSGTLTMPSGVDPPAECAAYFRPTIAPAAPPVAPKPPVSPPAPPTDQSSSSNIGIIVGASVAGAVVLAVLVAIVGMLVVKKRRRAAEAASDYGSQPPPYTLAGVPSLRSGQFASSPPTQGRGGPYANAAAVGSSPGMGSITPASGSQTESPFPPTSTATVSPRPSYGAAALTTDPLMQYINSRVSLVSHSSRGPLAAWELPFSEFQILRPIGEGSWGRCYSANWNETQVAVKVLLDGNVDNAQSSTPATQSALLQSNSPVFARLVQEASLMTQLHSPYIVQFLGMTTDPAALVTEYCSRGSLNFILQAANANPAKAAELTWTRRISMAADAVRGCLYLHNHSPPIIHRDLKSANLLITQAWTCKVADFNLSKVIEQTSRSTSLQAMNPRWLAPEVLEGGQASMASDVFAFGVIFWELLTWKLPWGTSNPWGIVSAVINNGRLEIPEPSDLPGPGSGNWPLLDRYIALMRRCWSQNPGDRPRFEEVMAELRNLDPQAIGA